MKLNIENIITSIKVKLRRSKLKSRYKFDEVNKIRLEEFNLSLDEIGISIVGKLSEYLLFKQNSPLDFKKILKLNLSEEEEKDLIDWIYESIKKDYQYEKKTEQYQDENRFLKEEEKDGIIENKSKSSSLSLDLDNSGDSSEYIKDNEELADTTESRTEDEEDDSEEHPFDEITKIENQNFLSIIEFLLSSYETKQRLPIPQPIIENQNFLSVIEVEVLLSSYKTKQNEPIPNPLSYGLSNLGINRILKRAHLKYLLNKAIFNLKKPT
jgi:hypothetical protein